MMKKTGDDVMTIARRSFLAGAAAAVIAPLPDVAAALPAAVVKPCGVWFKNGIPAASATEVYDDVVALIKVVGENGTLYVSNESYLAIQCFVNNFGVRVRDMLTKDFPRLKIIKTT